VTDSSTAELELQNMWLALQKKTWRVLAVVPSMREIASLEVASAIAEVAWQYRGEPTVVVDLRDITLRLVDYHKKQIDEHIKRGDCVIIALASIQQNPTTITLAKAADTAVLVVSMNETPMKAAVKTVEDIGHDKFAGTIVARRKSHAPEPVVVHRPIDIPKDPDPLVESATVVMPAPVVSVGEASRQTMKMGGGIKT